MNSTHAGENDGGRGRDGRGVVGGRFTDWPANLPHGELVGLVRRHVAQANDTLQTLAAAMPREFPLGDGEVLPADQRATGDHSPQSMADRAVAEIDRLRSAVTRAEARVSRATRQPPASDDPAHLKPSPVSQHTDHDDTGQDTDGARADIEDSARSDASRGGDER